MVFTADKEHGATACSSQRAMYRLSWSHAKCSNVVHCNEHDTGSQSLEVCGDDDDADYSQGQASATYGMRAKFGTLSESKYSNCDLIYFIYLIVLLYKLLDFLP
jgi:hypothetical protein